MTRFADGTSVPVARSRHEIESIVTKYGATRFASMTESGRALVMFEANDRRIVFELPLPSKKELEFKTWHGRPKLRTAEEVEVAFEQAGRQKWRALLLVIKAKLEAVESGISEFEDEFLANIILANGKTVGQWIRPQLEVSYAKNVMPPMLAAGDGR